MRRRLWLKLFAFSFALGALMLKGLDLFLLFFADGVIIKEPNKLLLTLEVGIVFLCCLILVLDFFLYVKERRSRWMVKLPS